MLAAALLVSWFAIEWTDEGAETYPGGVVLRDNAGNVIRVSLGSGDVDCRPYYTADPEDWIVKALIASEDGTFWTHRGVRPFSALRALWQNVFYARRISGASTITMQAVRLIKPHPKTLWWKYKEAIQALKMERLKDKRWILSQYLNRAPYGSNFIGIESAAAGWFGKSAKELGLGEAAMLAGMVQAPSRFRPDRGYERAIKRRDYVLKRMLETGVITEEQMEGAKRVRPAVCRAPRPFEYPHYCDWYLQKLGKGPMAQKRGGDFKTPLDADIEKTLEHAVNAAAEKGGYAVSAVVMKVATGEVVALACSGDYFDSDAGQVNTALAPRPAGSTLKPFLAAFAIDRGTVAPSERLLDVPMSYKGYRPSNFDGSYRGRVSLHDALVLSLNLPFVRLLQRTGVELFASHLRELGFEHHTGTANDFGLGMAIGNVEVTLVELVGAYARLARGDVYSPGASYLISDMLSGEERSSAAFGHVADVKTSRFAWKTGTSSAYRDAWTVVWNPEYVVGVWCGHKRGGFGDKKLVGAKAAAPVAWTIARSLYPRDNGPWFAEPSDLVRREVCAKSGLKASVNCSETESGIAVRGHTPPTLCGEHGFHTKVDEAKKLRFLKPEDGASYVLVSGLSQQRIVCQIAGNDEQSRLWWFVDGKSAGTTVGNEPFSTEMSVGEHTIVVATEDGASATVRYTIVVPKPKP